VARAFDAIYSAEKSWAASILKPLRAVTLWIAGLTLGVVLVSACVSGSGGADGMGRGQPARKAKRIRRNRLQGQSGGA